MKTILEQGESINGFFCEDEFNEFFSDFLMKNLDLNPLNPLDNIHLYVDEETYREINRLVKTRDIHYDLVNKIYIKYGVNIIDYIVKQIFDRLSYTYSNMWTDRFNVTISLNNTTTIVKTESGFQIDNCSCGQFKHFRIKVERT